MPIPEEMLHELERSLYGEIRSDLATRLLYSTDASIYSIEPHGVVFPRSLDDLQAVVEIAGKYKAPLLPRGGGSSLAGQAVGQALIIDCSRYLTRILEIDPIGQTAAVEPGVILSTLNRAASQHGLMFGPDPASAERATLGGSVANNASGAHSILYGMASDHVLGMEVVLSDGSLASFKPILINEARRRVAANGHSPAETQIYRAAVEIRDQHAGIIQTRWPKVWRRSSGYNLNYLLPWSASRPPAWSSINSQASIPYPPVAPDELNLAHLIAGSEGTLGLIRKMTLRMVPRLEHTILAVLTYESIVDACEATAPFLDLKPSAVELIPGSLIRLAQSVPAYARQLTFVRGDPEALLVLEFSGQDQKHLRSQIDQLRDGLAPSSREKMLVAETPEHQNQVWNVRKVGLGLIQSRPGDARGIGFIEDVAVPVEQLGTYVRGLLQIFREHHAEVDIYAHASSGCLHVRPSLNLKSGHDLARMRAITAQVLKLASDLGGALSGEHGDGLARSEWLESNFSKEIMDLFRLVKQAADPYNLFNPGKIIDPPPMDSNLRYGPNYRAAAWQPVFDFSSQGDLVGAIEMCNGAGVCRKDDGLMCPSFQAAQDEMHSTRGRANLLRALISGKFPTGKIAEAAVAQAFDLCLACKGCKAECPSAVDAAKLKYEYTNHYYKHRRRKLRDYIFGYIHLLAPAGHLFSPIVNMILGLQSAGVVGERLFGLAHQRRLPRLANRNQVTRIKSRQDSRPPEVLFLTDTFTHYFHPETEQASLQALAAAGLQVEVLPILGAGRTLISKGFLDAARNHARKLLAEIERLDPDGVLPVVGAEPSEIYTLSDEFPDFFPGDERVTALAKRSWMIDEFLLRPAPDGKLFAERVLSDRPKSKQGLKVLLHGHCYQKARPPANDGYPTGVPAAAALLRLAGYQVEEINSGCCGMAGAFGYEAEHYEFSMKIAELALLPAVRSTDQEVVIAAAGTSCRSQIEDGSGRNAEHPVCLFMRSPRRP
jgi:FAD/FMN-containing dehydrogenase/Fe-S oxidoreductase